MLLALKRWFKGYPSARWLEDADEEVKFTPDLWNMERRQMQLLFVYDELRQGKLPHSAG